jgi:hypothetical protein
MGQAVFDKKNNIFKIRKKDGEEVEIPALALQDAGLTTVKPTESFGRGGAGGATPGLITEKQMTSFEDQFKTEGMAAMFASQEATAMKGTLSQLTNSVFQQMGGKPEDRRNAKFKALEIQTREERSYWDRVNAVPELDDVQLANDLVKARRYYLHQSEIAKEQKNGSRVAFLKRKLTQIDSAKKRKDKEESIRGQALVQFEDRLRRAMDNPTMPVYKPNQTTRSMVFGIGATGQ